MRVRSIAAAFVLLTVMSGAVASGGATLNPRTRCAGYPEPRIYFETQAWWEPVPVIGGQGHIHMGTCWPHGQTVSGNVRLDFVVTFHHEVGTVERFKVQDDFSTDFNTYVSIPIDAATSDVTITRSVTIDTTKMPDGLRQWRIYVYFTHRGGNSQRTKAMYRVNVENVAGDTNEPGPRYSEYGGAGWYVEAEDGTDWGYQVARLDPASFLRIGGCVKGTWHPEVDLDAPGTTEYLVTVDPDFHMGDDGHVVASGQTFDGTLSFDTTTVANGWHRLVIHTGRRVGTEENGGVFVYPFRVCNVAA